MDITRQRRAWQAIVRASLINAVASCPTINRLGWSSHLEFSASLVGKVSALTISPPISGCAYRDSRMSSRYAWWVGHKNESANFKSNAAKVRYLMRISTVQLPRDSWSQEWDWRCPFERIRLHGHENGMGRRGCLSGSDGAQSFVKIKAASCGEGWLMDYHGCCNQGDSM